MQNLDWKPSKWSRQGDVKIKMISVLPEGDKVNAKDKEEEAVLAYGEVTGHRHRVIEGNVNLFTIGESQNMFSPKYLEVISDKAVVVHEEHTEILLVKGIYEISIQREYYPEEIRNVMD
jgi:hypothetical protein